MPPKGGHKYILGKIVSNKYPQKIKGSINA